jgi:hypothetical protein
MVTSVDRLESRLRRFERNLTVALWMAWINAAATITMLVKLWPTQ